MSDVERWHEWTQSITRVKQIGGKTFEVGSRYQVLQPKLPKAVWEVTEIIEGKSFTWVSSNPGVRVTGIHALEAHQGSVTVTLTLQYAGLFASLLARLTRNITERYIGYEANGLKQRSESSIPH